MMKTGLLWFDNDAGRDLPTKVARAAAHYQRKYGQAPQLCFVNPTSLNGSGDSLRVAGVMVMASRTVLPHHFWLGVKDDQRNGRHSSS
jgi:hypothetical protein